MKSYKLQILAGIFIVSLSLCWLPTHPKNLCSGDGTAVYITVVYETGVMIY